MTIEPERERPLPERMTAPTVAVAEDSQTSSVSRQDASPVGAPFLLKYGVTVDGGRDLSGCDGIVSRAAEIVASHETRKTGVERETTDDD